MDALTTVTSTPGKPDILYYDGQCSLCSKEMARLRKLKGANLELRDIHTLQDPALGPFNLGENRPDKDRLLRVLHLERNGIFLTGVDANVAAWEHTPIGFLWRWMRWQLIRPVVELAYNRWAQWRYDRLY